MAQNKEKVVSSNVFGMGKISDRFRSFRLQLEDEKHQNLDVIYQNVIHCQWHFGRRACGRPIAKPIQHGGNYHNLIRNYVNFAARQWTNGALNWNRPFGVMARENTMESSDQVLQATNDDATNYRL